MKNLLKLATLAGFCFAMIVFGACGGGSGGGSGAYTVTVNGTAYTASGTGSAQYTTTNGYTYFRTGTETNWRIYTGSAINTSTSTTSQLGVADPIAK